VLRNAAFKTTAAGGSRSSTVLRSFRDTSPCGEQRGGERRLHGLPPGAPAPAPQQLPGKRHPGPGTQRSLSQSQGSRFGVCVCVAGCSGFSEYVVVLRIRERRVEFSVLPFGFLQETKRMVPLGSGKNTLSLFSFFFERIRTVSINI